MKTLKKLTEELGSAAFALVRSVQKSIEDDTIQTVENYPFPLWKEVVRWVLDHPRHEPEGQHPLIKKIFNPKSGEDLVSQIAFDLMRILLVFSVVSDELTTYIDTESEWQKAIFIEHHKK